MKQNIMKNRDRSVWFRRLFIMTQRMSFILAPSHYSSLGAKPANLNCQVTLLMVAKAVADHNNHLTQKRVNSAPIFFDTNYFELQRVLH